ncbi:Uncharacterised protein [Shigella flexneri]|nr:Uncharacterised protein [Shigella flexneri]
MQRIVQRLRGIYRIILQPLKLIYGIADRLANHINSAVGIFDTKRADFTGVEQLNQFFLPAVTRTPGQRRRSITNGFLPLGCRFPVCIFIIEISVIFCISGHFARLQILHHRKTQPVSVRQRVRKRIAVAGIHPERRPRTFRLCQWIWCGHYHLLNSCT